MKVYLYRRPAIERASLEQPNDIDPNEVDVFDIECDEISQPGCVIYGVGDDGEQIVSFDAREIVDWADEREAVNISIVPLRRNAPTS